MELKSLLSGFTLGEKQDAGIMSVIPLLSEKDLTENLAEFEDVKFLRTSDYGHMVFNNSSDKPFILPTGYSVITRQAAQDHGSTFAYLLKPDKTRDIDGTCCIEETQGGFINGNTVDGFNILPLYVRRNHFKKFIDDRNEQLRFRSYDFSRLWSIISSFQKQLVGRNEAHLVYFFNKFMDQLNQFNAEFEVVDKQRGAIILLNDKIIGIEIAPTEKYWNEIWQGLIRDCYGSEIVRLAMSDLIKEFQNSQELELDLDSCNSIEEIEEAIKKHQKDYQESIGVELDTLLENGVKTLPKEHQLIRSNTFQDFTHHVFKLDNIDGYGEAYTEGKKIVYASIVL